MDEQKQDVGRVGDADRAGGPTDPSRQAVSAEGAHPSRKPNIECPRCGEGLHITAASVVDNKQRLTWSIHPKEGDLLQAKTVGGTLARMDELLRACAKEDGGNVRCYVERVYTDEAGAVHFDLAVLPVVKNKRARDRDGSGEADETPQEVRPEGQQPGPEGDRPTPIGTTLEQRKG